MGEPAHPCQGPTALRHTGSIGSPDELRAPAGPPRTPGPAQRRCGTSSARAGAAPRLRPRRPWPWVAAVASASPPAAAALRICRSIRSSALSRRSRASACRSAVLSRSDRSPRSASSQRIQQRAVSQFRPSSLATGAIVLPLLRTSSTASRGNSGGYSLGGIPDHLALVLVLPTARCSGNPGATPAVGLRGDWRSVLPGKSLASLTRMLAEVRSLDSLLSSPWPHQTLHPAQPPGRNPSEASSTGSTGGHVGGASLGERPRPAGASPSSAGSGGPPASACPASGRSSGTRPCPRQGRCSRRRQRRRPGSPAPS